MSEQKIMPIEEVRRVSKANQEAALASDIARLRVRVNMTLNHAESNSVLVTTLRDTYNRFGGYASPMAIDAILKELHALGYSAYMNETDIKSVNYDPHLVIQWEQEDK